MTNKHTGRSVYGYNINVDADDDDIAGRNSSDRKTEQGISYPPGLSPPPSSVEVEVEQQSNVVN